MAVSRDWGGGPGSATVAGLASIGAAAARASSSDQRAAAARQDATRSAGVSAGSTSAACSRAAAAGGREYTDDAMIAEAAGCAVHVFPGDAANFKLTTTEDFARAMEQLKAPALAALPDVRMGQGYDVHAFAEGDRVWLGGVAVPHSHALAGHSDADVLLHAITDAILGALSSGDIGTHFPNTDPRWKGCPSRIFVEKAVEEARAAGYVVGNLDCTILAERPKIAPHVPRMKETISQLLQIPCDCISIKATTMERLGAIGRSEGIAAQAIVLLFRKLH